MNFYDFLSKDFQYQDAQPASQLTAQFASLFARAYLNVSLSDETDTIAGTRTSDTRYTRSAGSFDADLDDAKYCISYLNTDLASLSWHLISAVAEDKTYIDIDATYGDATLAVNANRLILLTTDELESMRLAAERLAIASNEVTLEVADIQIGAVEIKDPDTDIRLDIATDSTKNAAYVQSESLAQESGGNLATIAGIDFATETTLSGVAQESGGNLDTIAGIDFATETTLGTLGTETTLADIKTAAQLLDNVVATIGGVVLNRVGLFDKAGNQITALSDKSNSGNCTYSTEQADFTAAVTDSSYDIVLSVDNLQGESITEAHFANGILKVYDASASELKTITLDKYTWVIGTKTLTVTNCANAFEFATGDIVSLTLIGPDKGYDNTNHVQLVQEQSPAWEHFTLPVSLLGASQDLTGSWLDCGDEIFCSGYDAVFLFFTIDINDSTDIRIRALGKHTSTGAEEYNLPIKTISSTVVSIDDEYFELANDSDQLVIVQVQTNRGIPYLQVQIEAGTVGASCGQIDALYYTLA